MCQIYYDDEFMSSRLHDFTTSRLHEDQGWIGYARTHVPMFVHKLGLIKPRQT